MSPTGPKAPTAVTQSGGGAAWTNINNVLAEDGSVATSGVIGPGGGGAFPQQLNVTGFGFSIPTTAVIDGIKLELKVNAGAGNNDNGYIYLLYNGGSTSTANTPNAGQNWPVGALSWLTYGGSTSLWGKAWTPADINNVAFGASFATMLNTGTGQVFADAVRITIYWHNNVADVPKRYLYKTFNSGGTFLGLLPVANTNEFTFSQDVNTSGTTLNVECAVSIDTSAQPNSVYTDESGTPYTDESGANSYTTEGALPQVALGNAPYDVLLKNGNKVVVYEVSYWYPNGKAMFSGRIEHIEGGFGGDNGHDSVQLIIYSDGADLDNYIARGAPFSYTTDQSQTSQNASETINQVGAAYARSGQSFKTGASVTNVGAITIMLNGTATVTVNLWDSPNKITLLGTASQSVSVGAATSIQFAFPGLITVSSNSIYFFEVLVSDGQSITIYYQNTDVYSSGQHYNANYGGGSGGGAFGAGTGDLYFNTASGSGSTTGTYTSQDPTIGMLEPIVTDYNLRGGLISYNSTTIDATGLSLTYGLNTNTILEAINAILTMAPNQFYWYIDLGADLLYFKQASSTADFVLTKGVHINDLNLVLSIENVKNSIYFSGGTVSGSNIYTQNQDNASIAAYGVRLDRQSDNRVTDLPTARVITSGNVKKQKDEQQQTVVRVLSTKTTDTTQLRPGKTIGFNGFGTFVDNLILQVVRWEYHPDYVILTLGILPRRMSPRFEQIVRGLVAQQTVANPSTPS